MSVFRVLLLLASPVIAVVVIISLLIGFASFGDAGPVPNLAQAVTTESDAQAQILLLLSRLLFFPFQVVFIGLVAGVTLWVYRRSSTLARWVLGEPVTDRLARDGDKGAAGLVAEVAPVVTVRPGRRRTIHQVVASLIAVTAILTALVLIVGQFVGRSDLVVVVTALTSSLAWGARLPVADLLGGLTGIFENNLEIGDRISYRHFQKSVDGVVENVDLRFVTLRAVSGELVSIPHGELRIFRNLSRTPLAGVYVVFPVVSSDLSRAVDLLDSLADQSMALVPELVEPWQTLSQNGEIAPTTDVCLYGRTQPGHEDELQLAIYRLVHAQFEAQSIRMVEAPETDS